MLSAEELLYFLTQSTVGDETETKEVVVKKDTFECNPETGRLKLVYNEHVETVDVLIKFSDRMKARDLLRKYHNLFTDKVDLKIATIFNDSIGQDDEKNKKNLEK